MWFKKKVEKAPEFKPIVSMAKKGRPITICESMCDKDVRAGDKGVLLAEVWNAGGRSVSFYSLFTYLDSGTTTETTKKGSWSKTWYMVRMDLDKKMRMIPKSICRLDPDKPKPKKKRAKKVKN